MIKIFAICVTPEFVLLRFYNLLYLMCLIFKSISTVSQRKKASSEAPLKIKS